ncbi:MAG: DNA gyrase subunit A [Gemmatimonadales bacterium]|nr:DNA gyrase subunit A [Gemmatimonadales bacterium]NIN11095.1 DNA gyrase subunit A [Gemmatimonadales bacterium]NIN49692.1 DNA gyrase subunit A [Gemmatimonadales bacterium]NIP07156.1 DNA gyrase subunit A [Gemmatimonadales bacterium]NIQ99548.1 DNA gyrase subunit A [Gemmatimonadales bacterium]
MTAPNQRERILPRLIEDEMKESFIDYSMSVIVQRALPDVRDGLKPVHRRILYAMSELGLQPGRPYKKSATVVGDVLGKYHPHGDMAVYDSLVRMVQDFSLRYPLVDGQGNFGSVDGDSAAAYRYTEARLTPMAVAMLEDIDKNTVGFVPNFDDRLAEPTVLPSRLPNLLINGSSGIAVGMATNVPPHNLGEVVDAVKHLVDNPECGIADLHQHLQGPDFPTGGFICGLDGIKECYDTGRGRIVMRARAQVEERASGKQQIVVTEIPFQVNKARLIEQVADLVRRKKVSDIADLRDESDRDGMRVVVELRRDANPTVVLNQLYKHTQMQATFGAIMLALVDGQPKVMNLKELLQQFVDHRHEVIIRRTEYDLEQAKVREHILQGLTIAVDNIDEVVKIIRKAKDVPAADAALRKRFELSEKQSEAILNMRLARLTSLEIDKLQEELKQVRKLIRELKGVLASKAKRMGILKEELDDLVKRFGDARRTELVPEEGEFSVEDLIAEEDMVVTISHAGYIKRIPVTTYRRQRRGGRGLNGMGTREDDWVEHLFIASTHDYVLFFTHTGHVYWLKVYDIPQGGRAARGKPIVNLIRIRAEQRIAAFVAVREFTDRQYLMFATAQGIVKKTSLSAYGNPRSTGINAINIEADDDLIDVQLTDGSNDIVLATRFGMSIRFSEKDVREMGRATTGVRGIQLEGDDRVIGMVVIRRDATLLVVSERGMGKRSELTDYRVQKRGGKGIITLKRSDKTGAVVALKEVLPDDELMMVTRHGVIIRVPVEGIRVIGRNTQGVRVMNLDSGDAVVDVARVVKEDETAGVEEPAAAQVVSEGRDQREMEL